MRHKFLAQLRDFLHMNFAQNHQPKQYSLIAISCQLFFNLIFEQFFYIKRHELYSCLPSGINEKGFVDSNSLSKLLHRNERGSVGMQLWWILINILSKSSKVVHFSQICYTFMSCSVIHYQIDVVVVLIISQLLSKNCSVIFSAPRSWRQVCAIQTFVSKRKL